MTAVAEGTQPITFSWSSTAGTFSAPGEPTVTWTAPDVTGESDVAVVATNADGSRRATVRVHVDRPRPVTSPHGSEPPDRVTTMPQFPWPPPRWTTRQTIPSRLAAPEPATLGSMFDGLKAALTRAGITDWSAYGIGDDGFAIAARMESIRDDGRPLPVPNRWSIQPMRTTTFDVAEILRRAFSAAPGRYRIIALLVTPRTVAPGPSANAAAVTRLPDAGAGQLPSALAATPAPPQADIETLVYEFFRASPADSIRLVPSGESRLTARSHVIAAGLWTENDLR